MSIRRAAGAGIVVALACAALAAAAAGAPMVKVRDACDPATFNAVLGAGACVDGGSVTFDAFIDGSSAAATTHCGVSRPGAPRSRRARASL